MAIDLPNGYVGQGRRKATEDVSMPSVEDTDDLARLEPRNIRPLPVKASSARGPVPAAGTKARAREPPVSASVTAGSKPRVPEPPKARLSSSTHLPPQASIPVATTQGKGSLFKMSSLPSRDAAPALLSKEDLISTKAIPPPLPPRPIPKTVASLQSSTAHMPSPAPSADTLPGKREDWEDSGVMDVDDSGDTPEWFNAPLPRAREEAPVEAPQPQETSTQPPVTTRANNSAPLTPVALAWRPEPERRASTSSLVSRLSSGFNFIASAFSPSVPPPSAEPPLEKDVMPMVEIRHSPVSYRPETPATFVTASEMVSSAASAMEVDAAPPAPSVAATQPVRAKPPAALERKRTSKTSSDRRDGALRPSTRQPKAKAKVPRSGDGNVKAADRRRGATGTSSAATAGSALPRSGPIARTRPAAHPAPIARPVSTARAPPIARSAPPARPAPNTRPTPAVSRPRVPSAPELPFYGPPALPQAKFEAYRDSLASRSPARVSLRDVERAIDIEARRRYWEEVWRSDTEGQSGGTPARFPLSLDPGAAASPDPRAEEWRNRAGRESRQRAAQRQVFDSRRKELEQLKKDEVEREKAALSRITAEVVKELRNAPRGRARR
ncbi:uncharacterized protein LOC62_04G005910 [Vanrija pseudolonga]|uniref:Uncharacterized protein n=1 Tax=Vanrija pseudolonga TaxID=143232 RepID=A0AAF1BJ77_9TREE|nr:hypothetical protein LOC62_04G005910 [Vanrija pseudolonga]